MSTPAPESALRVEPRPRPTELDGLKTAPAPERRAPAAARNGHAAPDPAAAAPTAGRKRRRLLWLIPILLIVGAVATTLGYRFWYESAYFVMTENAQVTGDLVQVGSLNAGRLTSTRVEVGDVVKQGQEIAVVSIPQQIGSVPFSGAAVLGETGNSDTQTSVRSPLSGIVAARLGSAGGTVSAGQPIYALVDPTQI